MPTRLSTTLAALAVAGAVIAAPSTADASTPPARSVPAVAVARHATSMADLTPKYRRDPCRLVAGVRTCVHAEAVRPTRLTPQQQKLRSRAIARMRATMRDAAARREAARASVGAGNAAYAAPRTGTVATDVRTASIAPAVLTELPRSLGPAAVAPAAALAATAIPPTPTVCDEAYNTRDVVTYPDRVTTCSDASWQVSTYVVTATGQQSQTGYLNLESMQWIAYAGPSSGGAPVWDHAVTLVTYNSGGTLAQGIVGQVTSLCSTGSTCTVLSELVPPDPTMVPAYSYSYYFQESDPNVLTTPNTVTNLSGSLGIQLYSPTIGWVGHDYGSYEATGDVLAGRCDSVNDPSATVLVNGCVDQNFTPTLTYDATANSAVTPVAEHVFTAQKSLPVAYGVPASASPLSYDGIAKDAADATAIACATVPVQVDLACSQYPFADTRQSAHWLGGPPKVSVATVAGTAATAATTIDSDFRRTNRIVDGDPFWVRAVRPDGTASW